MAQATDQQTARHYWSTPYAFEPYAGGLGATLAVSSSTGRVALAMPDDGDVNCIVIFNTGTVFAFVRLGDVTVVATTACMAVPPGGALTISLTTINSDLPTHIAAITASSTTTIQATAGLGGV